MKFILLFQAIVAATDYDYIVVGSGTGGGTVATELAMKGFKTLLIEAGPDYFQANQSTPIFHGKASEDPAISFDFDVKHYDNDVRYFYPRAGVLGGCSVHNTEISIYPNTRDFELMQRITGDNEWSEENMRNYFKRVEDNQYLIKLLHPDHGFDGWFKTSYINFLAQLKLDVNLVDLLLAVIGNPLFDINGRGPFGLNSDKEAKFFIPQSIDATNYTRDNFPQYIRSVAKNFPLTIWTDTFVTKVLFEGTAAVGVEYKQGKYLYKASPLSSDANRNSAKSGTVTATKEIILSGGTFNTPQLLMLSGIGDKDQLASFDIPVVSHVPGVGRKMMDRYEIPIVVQFNQKYRLLRDCKFTPTEDDPCYQEFITKHAGPYTSNGIVSGQSLKSNANLGEPDLFILNVVTDFHGYFRGYSNNIAERTDSATRLILKAHTNNTNGRVSLLSNDPFDVPDINFHSFTDGDTDLNILIDAVKRERAFFKENIFVPYKELFPGSHVQTDEDIRNYIKNLAWGHHACCTARMGTSDDPTAVVDNKFRVRGVTNLRVVDMSIFPEIPGYFPIIYIQMMAMKAADDIISKA